MDITELENKLNKQEKQLQDKDLIIKSLCDALNDINRFYYDIRYNKQEIQGGFTKRNLLDIDSNNDAVKTCMLCLFPLNESLHGSFSPVIFKLNCGLSSALSNSSSHIHTEGHKFHLLCLNETIQRRVCRKSCSVCWEDITEDEQNEIIESSKEEKKEINIYNHKLAKDIIKY